MNRDFPCTARRGTPAASKNRAAAATLLCALLLATVGWPVMAGADEYDDQSDVQQRIAGQENAAQEADQRLVKATQESQVAQAQLKDAQAKLAASVQERTKAQGVADQRARELTERERELRAARDKLAGAKVEVAAERKRIGQIATTIYQQQGELESFAVMLSSKTTGEFSSRLQWNDQMVAVHKQAMEGLERKQAVSELAEHAQHKAELAAQEARRQSEEALAARQNAEREASSQEQHVSKLAGEAEAKRVTADKAVQEAQAQLAHLRDEQAAVEQRIRERIAREEAARRAAEEAARRAAEEEAARRGAPPGAIAPAPVPGPINASGFVRPVDGPVTSGYGMRWHPVVGGWVFHDGTDYGAGCGAPLFAAAAGTVIENYYDNSGFGNRLIIDHGRMGDGSYFSTGYNHASNYIVGVGERVEQGQVIGYVGNTGYSTGCHLHLNLWINGSITDPVGSGYFS